MTVRHWQDSVGAVSRDPLDPMGFYLSAWFWGCIVLVVAMVASFAFGRPAGAQAKPGIWLEGTFTVNDEAIQKFRDTTHGSNNACYLIRRTLGGLDPSHPEQEIVTMTCTAEPKP